VTARSRSIVASALLLLIGAASGIAVDHLVLFHRHHSATGAASSGTSTRHMTTLLAELDRVLQLTPAQHDSISAILTRHQQSIDSAWRVIHGQVNAGMDSVHRELQAILRPEQMTLLRDWMSRQHMAHASGGR
jgi:hypothetical protein